jgi:hypothetical protein
LVIIVKQNLRNPDRAYLRVGGRQQFFRILREFGRQWKKSELKCLKCLKPALALQLIIGYKLINSGLGQGELKLRT